MATPAPIVLVHGAWGGAWIWRRVLAPLRAAGHEVHAVTLTGDGDRAHQRHPGINMATHVADVLALIEAEELESYVLVGHSYGGAVITAAVGELQRRLQAPPQAAAVPGVPARMPRGLVYVDAMVPLPGEAWGSRHSPGLRAKRLALAAANAGALPPGDPEAFGLQGADRAWLLRRQVPHPFGMYEEPIQFELQQWLALPRCFIDCMSPAYPTIADARQRVRQQPGWQVVEMATGHCPMVSQPQALVRHLLHAAA